MLLSIVNVSEIEEGERYRKEYGDLTGLVESIKEHGIIQPLAVSKKRDDGYKLVAGGRRFAAINAAGITEVPVRIYTEELSDLELRGIELEENIQRKDLEWTEEVRLKDEIHNLQVEIYGPKIARAPDAPGHSMRDTARMLGEDISTTSRDINLAEALQSIPDLARCKNKHEATKLLATIEKAIVNKNKASKIAETISSTPMDIKKRNLIEHYIVDDAISGMKALQQRTFDIVEIDPPYAIELKGNKRSPSGNILDYTEVRQKDYIEFMSSVLEEAYRILKPDGWLILWYAISPWHDAFFSLAKEIGFTGRDLPAIWAKEAGQTQQPQTYLASTYEPFFYFTKANGEIEKRGRANVFKYKKVNPDMKIHPTERPIELMMDIYQTFGGIGSSICIPFLGSGTGLLAAFNNNMTGIGFDLSDVYRDEFVVRVTENEPPYTSYKEKQV